MKPLTKRQARFWFSFFAIPLFLLPGCESVRSELGLNRSSPDEFAVIRRAPLEIPPEDEALPVPMPGASRPQEISAEQEARQAILGEDAKRTDSRTRPSDQAEQALLEKSGAETSDPSIRRTVDKDLSDAAQEETVAERLLGWRSSRPGSKAPARIIDPEAEALRLKNLQKASATATP